MKTNNLWLSPLCSNSQVKANNGRNTIMKILAHRHVLFVNHASINEKINYKSFYANPMQYYSELLKNKTILINLNK